METASATPQPVQIKLLTLQFAPELGAIDAQPLEAFLIDKEVLTLRDHFFEVHGIPHLLCLVTFRQPQSQPAPPPEPEPQRKKSRRSRPRPPALDESQQQLFETLRRWRADRAYRDGMPLYVIFNNRELSDIVRARPASTHALREIRGVGPGKAESYGDEILAIVRADVDPAAAADRQEAS